MTPPPKNPYSGAHDNTNVEETGIPDPRPLVMLRPTFSRAELLMLCSYPWDKTVRHVEVDEPALYGSAFHLVMATVIVWWHEKKKYVAASAKVVEAAAERFGIDCVELAAHVKSAAPVLYDWLRASNPWNVDFIYARFRVELPLAYDVARKKARIIAGPTEDTHEYLEALPHEFPGTADLIIDGMPDRYRAKGVPHFITLDHKSGEFCDLPQESEQVKTISNAYDSIVKHEKGRLIAGAIFHAGRGGVPTIYAHEFEKKELTATRVGLLRAFSRIGDGSLSPGSHCTICPAMSICPAYTSALEKIGDGSLSLMTPEKLGQQHQAVQLIGKYLERWRADAKAWIREHGVGVRPDGSTVALVEKDVERVSKTNVIEAIGAAKAEAVFAEWRKKGYLKTDTQEELRVVKEA